MVSQIQCFLLHNIFDLNRRLKWFFVEWYFIQIFSKYISDRIESEKISKELKTAQYAYCMLHFIAIFESNLWSMWNEHFNRTRTYTRICGYGCVHTNVFASSVCSKSSSIEKRFFELRFVIRKCGVKHSMLPFFSIHFKHMNIWIGFFFSSKNNNINHVRI